MNTMIRRTAAVGMTTAALALAAAVPMAAPAVAAGVSPSHSATARTAPPHVSYHAISSVQQTARFATLRAKGYRPITVSVTFDAAGRTRYSATWLLSGHAPGGNLPWALYQDMSPSGYQTRFEQLTAQGFQPAVISATGTGTGARFAAIFVKKPGSRFIAKHGISAAELRGTSTAARAQGLMLTSVDVYGTASARRYAAVWSANPGRAKWLVKVGLPQAEHEAEFKRQVAKGYRATAIAMSTTGQYTTVWRDDKIGPWYSYINMTASAYQSRFDELGAKGFYPVHISTELGRYAAIWTR
ncbi:hypothetical protein OIE67_20585 [Nonomuraea fuscirosea]|uniref:hypothetical protein n=1 Tax=Nonomuraea fuscirosea TaxID=1291556 RepID=UPI002DDB9C5C|nr:hypothetical protein [Nonomuraea fuscirosea]WSA56916.1 hypothetical protein OIE67_20585 [Nonomuraea fuscirosea]